MEWGNESNISKAWELQLPACKTSQVRVKSRVICQENIKRLINSGIITDHVLAIHLIRLQKMQKWQLVTGWGPTSYKRGHNSTYRGYNSSYTPENERMSPVSIGNTSSNHWFLEDIRSFSGVSTLLQRQFLGVKWLHSFLDRWIPEVKDRWRSLIPTFFPHASRRDSVVVNRGSPSHVPTAWGGLLEKISRWPAEFVLLLVTPRSLDVLSW